MSLTIRKYPIHSNNPNEIELPLDSEILCIQIQNDKPFLYVMIDTNKIDTETRSFATFNTGEHIDESKHTYEYFYTFQIAQIANDNLVFHAFEMFPKITADSVKEVRAALDVGLKEAKVLLEEHKGNIKSLFDKFSITKIFKEFQASKEEGIIPEEILGDSRQQNGYLYLDRQCAIIILDVNRYELILGNMDYVSNDLTDLELKLYQWAISEGY